MNLNRLGYGLAICAVLALMSQAAFSQTTGDPDHAMKDSPPRLIPPPCNSYTMKQALKLTWHQKLCYYAENRVLTGSGIFGSLFFGAVGQFRHDPEEWGQGAEGYGRRVGTRYAQGVAKSTAEFLVGAINHEDPRSRPPVNMDAPDTRTLRARLGAALVRTVWTHRDTGPGHDGIAFSRIAGALTSGFVGNAWYPDRLATTRQAFARTGSAFSGYVINNLFSEFQPELFRAVRKMLGLAPKKPSQMKH
ncbi:MAG: hypothetical protein AABO41_04775 [Acidobacteriota bacterium]